MFCSSYFSSGWVWQSNQPSIDEEEQQRSHSNCSMVSPGPATRDFTREISAISQTSIPERLPRLQCVLNPLLRLLLTAKRLEPFALEIKDVVFANRRTGRDVASAQHFGDFCAQLDFVVCDVVTLAHEVNAHLERG